MKVDYGEQDENGVDLSLLRRNLLTLETDIGDLDLLGDVAGIDSFDGLWERSVEMDLDGLRIRVASLDDLIAMKRAANRVKDRAHLLELEALRRLIQSEER